jgi:hypothetical protein
MKNTQIVAARPNTAMKRIRGMMMEEMTRYYENSTISSLPAIFNMFRSSDVLVQSLYSR